MLNRKDRAMRALTLLPLLLAATCFTACAQVAGGARAAQMRAQLKQHFAEADANGDGRLTRDEADGKMPWVSRNFDAIDSAHAGSVTMDQIQAYAVAQGRGRKRGAQ
jgi:hypothetical protein